jgi:alkylglycerol monooxygenase
MNPIAFAIPVFMATILLEAAVARRRGIPAYRVPDALTSLHYGVVSQVVIAFTYLFTFGYYVLAYEHLRLFSLPRNEPWVWVLALLVYDFCYYWAHRAGHEVNLLWASHQVHHSSEYFNLTTALRQTATGAFTAWPFYVAMAVIGIPPRVFALVALVDLLYQYWVHTELVPRLGPIEKVFVTPSHHRVHHGQNDYCIDRNYGGILVVWDRMFGSFAAERVDEPVVYGIRTRLANCNPLWGNLKGYRDLWRASVRSRGLGGFLRAWFGPPDPAGRFAQPAAAAQFRRFDPPASAALRRYALAQYALLVPLATHFIATASSLGLAARSAYAAVLLAWVVSIGRLLDGARHAMPLEIARVTTTAVAFASSGSWFGLAVPMPVAGVAVVATLASLALLPRRTVAGPAT